MCDTPSSFRTVRHFDGVSLFQPNVSPTFALLRPYQLRPTTWPSQQRARDRARRGGDVAIPP